MVARDRCNARYYGRTAAAVLRRRRILRREGWAGWHELGHHHQLTPYSASETFAEVSVNMYSQAADLLEAVPHSPTALTGPYWYGQGWDDAVHHLRDLAGGMD